MRKDYFFSAIALSLVLSMLVVDPVRATTSTDLQQKQNKLEQEEQALKNQKKELEKKKNENQKNLNNANGKVNSIAADQGKTKVAMDETSNEIVSMMADIDLIKEEIERTEEQIKVKTAEYEDAKQKEDTLYEAMLKRIKYLYEQGESSYIQILLTAADYSDALNKAQYIEQIYEYDREKLKEYVEAKTAADKAKTQLEEEKGQLETSKFEMEEEQHQMEEVLKEYKAKYSDYEVKLAKAKQDAALYTAQIKSQQADMAALQKQIASKQNEVNETKKAAQAAREAEEAERKRQVAEAAEKSKSESGGGGGNAGESSPSGGSKNSSPPPAPSGGGSGSNIASYACQFVGNPYVSGGTSLTNGADCSGFVYSVYKAFGISVPRTSWEQGNYGTEVSYSDAQPGDVIYYGGHVGIYIGGGQIVHASTQKTGIKYSSAMYRPIICVRRFV